MTKPDLNLIHKPASTETKLFEDSAKEAQREDSASDLFAPKVPEGVKVTGQITGRVPASSGAFGFVNSMDPNLGAGMRVALFHALKDAGLAFVETLYTNSGGDFDGPFGSAVGLKYEEKTHESGSRYVREDEVRKACDEAFRRDGRDIIWVESEGISEMGKGAGGTLPLGAFADANANLKLSGIVRYRRLEPYESASGKLLKGQALINAANVPITASLARRMPAGGEFEITGEGNISLTPELEHPVGAKTKGATLGATAKVGSQMKFKGETTISVQRLPYGEEVLVKIAYARSSNANVGASVTAGATLKKETYEQIPQLGRGALKFLLDRMGLPDAPAFVKKFLQSQIQAKSRYERRGSEIARFVFDLSKPSARQAYEAIFTRFSLAKTKELIASNDESVRAQKAGERVSIWEKGIAARLGETKLYLLSALQAEREGHVSIDGRANVVYRDTKFEKNYVNWISGEQKIKWEAVSVGREKDSQQSYFHLAYLNRNRLTSENQIDLFLRFVRSLGIETTFGKEAGDIQPESLAKALADRDDTETRADLYFTHEGIKRVAKSSKEECLSAYLQADAELSQKQKVQSTPLLERFLQISRMWFFVRVFYWGEISKLKQEYAEKVPGGRGIEADAKVLAEALDFAENVRKMAQQDERTTRDFFLKLAKTSGFEFMRKIAALTKLSSTDESIVHELSMSGGGLTIGAVDEGEILHPEKAMNRMLTKIA